MLLRICITSDRYGNRTPSSGERLAQMVAHGVALRHELDVSILRVACLNGCKNACQVMLTGRDPGGYRRSLLVWGRRYRYHVSSLKLAALVISRRRVSAIGFVAPKWFEVCSKPASRYYGVARWKCKKCLTIPY